MNNRSGFALVISVVIFGMVILTIAAATAFSLANAQAREVGWQDGLRTQSLAEGCAEYALFKLRDNPSYTGNENVTINGSTCTVRPLISGTPTTIQTEATVDNRHWRVEVKVTTSTFTINSWKRVSSF